MNASYELASEGRIDIVNHEDRKYVVPSSEFGHLLDSSEISFRIKRILAEE